MSYARVHRSDLVRLAGQPTGQQCFSLTSNQHQPPVTCQPAVFFSHNKSAPATPAALVSSEQRVGFHNKLETRRGFAASIVVWLFGSFLVSFGFVQSEIET
jgi:hypothetical protein